ncbi:MAG TPA: ImmA/IrrE family metallo-endopeptidase [Lacunisphaera sp.]
MNANHSEARQRFTIAHELGHFFLHAGDPVFVDQSFVMMRDTASSEGEKVEEREANLFAAELLMPAKLIVKEVEDMDDIDIVDDGKIGRLADKFGVSVQAMSFRLANLGVSLA